MGGALSCCLPCAGGGVPSGGRPGTGGSAPNAPRATTTTLEKSLLKQQRAEDKFNPPTINVATDIKLDLVNEECIALGNFHEFYFGDVDEEENDDNVDDEEVEEGEVREEENGEFGKRNKSRDPKIVGGEDGGLESAGQHRLSPRLHDIEEEEDEDGRNPRER